MDEVTSDANRARLALARKKTESDQKPISTTNHRVRKHSQVCVSSTVTPKCRAEANSIKDFQRDIAPLRRRQIAFLEAIDIPHKKQKITRGTPRRQAKEHAPVEQQATNDSNETNRQAGSRREAP